MPTGAPRLKLKYKIGSISKETDPPWGMRKILIRPKTAAKAADMAISTITVVLSLLNVNTPPFPRPG